MGELRQVKLFYDGSVLHEFFCLVGMDAKFRFCESCVIVKTKKYRFNCESQVIACNREIGITEEKIF